MCLPGVYAVSHVAAVLALQRLLSFAPLQLCPQRATQQEGQHQEHHSGLPVGVMAVAEDAPPELKLLQLRCILDAKERECALLREQLASEVRTLCYWAGQQGGAFPGRKQSLGSFPVAASSAAASR